MLKQSFTIPEYNWTVDVYYKVTKYYIDEILHKLEALECPEKHILSARKGMIGSRLNTGLTYSNNTLRYSVMVISKTSSPKEFINSYFHECRHLERHIEERFDISPYGEEAAYLAGKINELMFPVAKNFLCGCHRDKVLALI